MTFLMLVNKAVGTSLQQQLQIEHPAFVPIYQTVDVDEARGILSTHTVDVLLCDIDLFGNRDIELNRQGLDFLRWLRENSRQTVSIVLTSRASTLFDRQMAQLGVFETVHKPTNGEMLFSTITRARIYRDAEFCKELSRREKDQALQRFWMRLFEGELPCNRSAIEAYVSGTQLTIPVDDLYQPFLLTPRDEVGEIRGTEAWIWDCSTIQADVERCIAVMPFLSKLYTAVVRLSDRSLLLLAALPQGQVHTLRARITGECLPLLGELHRTCGADFRIYLCGPCEITRIVAATETLQFARYYGGNQQSVVDINTVSGQGVDLFRETENQAMLEWRRLFSSGSLRRVRDMITAHLQVRQQQTRNDLYYLARFNLVYDSLLVEYMISHLLVPEKIYEDDEHVLTASLAMRSYEGAIRWVTLSTELLATESNAARDSLSLVENVREYIRCHLDSPISVEGIANSVHLHPDHLNRLFKKAMGLSLQSYIVRERIEAAKWYLTHSSQTAAEIAPLVGYSNYATFYRAFVQQTGDPPKAWRVKAIQGNDPKAH